MSSLFNNLSSLNLQRCQTSHTKFPFQTQLFISDRDNIENLSDAEQYHKTYYLSSKQFLKKSLLGSITTKIFIENLSKDN